MSKPIIAETTHGARYGFADEESMRRVFPEATIVGYQDGTPYDAEAAAKPISKMNRDELEARAVELGIENPEEYANVGALREAITEAEEGGE